MAAKDEEHYKLLKAKICQLDQKKLMRPHFFDLLQHTINPGKLALSLYKKDVINFENMEECIGESCALYQNMEIYRAAIKKNAGVALVDALYETGNFPIVQLLHQSSLDRPNPESDQPLFRLREILNLNSSKLSQIPGNGNKGKSMNGEAAFSADLKSPAQAKSENYEVLKTKIGQVELKDVLRPLFFELLEQTINPTKLAITLFKSKVMSLEEMEECMDQTMILYQNLEVYRAVYKKNAGTMLLDALEQTGNFHILQLLQSNLLDQTEVKNQTDEEEDKDTASNSNPSEVNICNAVKNIDIGSTVPEHEPQTTEKAQGSEVKVDQNEEKDPWPEFKALVKEALDSAFEEYVQKMEDLLGDLNVLDPSNLQTIHEDYKGQAIVGFDSFYKHLEVTYNVATKIEGPLIDVDLSFFQNQLLEEIDKQFKSYQETNDLRHSHFVSKARNSVSYAEKMYIAKMTEHLDTCINEIDLFAAEGHAHEEAIGFVHDSIVQNSFSTKSDFIQQLTEELSNFIRNWFKSQLELFQLKRDEDEVVVREALMTAKIYYNDEMEKHFSSNNYMEPSTLAELDERISAAAMKNTLDKKDDLKLTSGQQTQLKEAMKVVFKKYEERNLLRKPTKTPAIGIDLGTTYSCVAVVINGKVEVIRNENGNNTTPSYAAFQEDGSVVSGDAAKDQSYRNPQNTVFDSKRLIGRKFRDIDVQESVKSWPFQVIEEGGKPKVKISHGAKTYHAEEISARVLKKMKEVAEDFLDTKVEAAVITVPALFNDAQRQATKDAAEIAGLKVLRIINEPTAAAIAYRLNRLDDIKRNVMVFDLGGGTFDVAVLKITGGEINVQAVHGDTHLGGEDFDEEMIKTCIAHFQKTYGINLARGRTSQVAKERFDVSCRLRRLRNECERQKRVLSSAKKTVVGLDVIDSSYPNLDLHVPFTREMFEIINQKHFDKCLEIVAKVLKEAKMAKSDIDDIVLVGGSTRIPKIQGMLTEFFEGKSLTKTINPDEAVAVGAAIQACILNGEQVPGFEGKPLKLKDVTPFSIGIQNWEKRFVVQIPKNSKVPIAVEQEWETMYDYQSSVTFHVYEGEYPMAPENNLLGTFVLRGIPSKKAREEKMMVTTAIDEDGILSLRAVCLSNEVTSGIKITAYKDKITLKEIQEAKESCQ